MSGHCTTRSGDGLRRTAPPGILFPGPGIHAPMSPTTEQLIQSVHRSTTRFVLAVSGGGSGAIAGLLEVPGASHTLLEAAVPYSEPAMIAWLGARPDQSCSEPTARAMAMAAYLRACRYWGGFRVQGSGFRVNRPEVGISEGAETECPEPRTLNPEPFPALAGVACTASLASDRPKRGPHRAHLAIQTAAMTVSQSVELQKGRRSRAEEEAVVARLVLGAVARACEVQDFRSLEDFGSLWFGLVEPERVEQSQVIAPTSWQDLLAGRVEAVQESGGRRGTGDGGRGAGVQGSGFRVQRPDAAIQEGAASEPPEPRTLNPEPPPASRPQSPRVVVPGAFNPVHVGHRRMAEIASGRLGRPVEFEISILNVDKPPLDFLEIQRRAGQFGPQETLWLTRAATFEAKSRLFPGATFVVGADTLRRIADARYFGGDTAACQRAIAEIAARGCRFLVFGRQEVNRFVGLADLDLPPPLRSLCQEIPASEFREDVSSTEIRRAQSP